MDLIILSVIIFFSRIGPFTCVVDHVEYEKNDVSVSLQCTLPVVMSSPHLSVPAIVPDLLNEYNHVTVLHNSIVYCTCKSADYTMKTRACTYIIHVCV